MSDHALTPAETAFFESGGETPIVETPEVATEQPAKVEDQPVVDVPRDEKGKFVPHQALHAEREEHKKTRSELQEIRQKQAVLEDRWNTLLKATGPEEKAEDVPPDPNVDIFAYAAWQKKQFEALNTKVQERDKQEQQAKEAQEQDSQLWGHWQQSRQAYAAEKPDFDAAATFLAEQRDKQLAAYGILDGKFQTKAARDAQINNELKSIILAAGQKGINPADAVYQIAQQYGYSGKQAETAADPNEAKLSEKLDTIAKAMDQSKSLGQAQGKAGGDAMTVETLLAMSDKEFEAWTKNPANAARYKTLMGG